MMGITGAFSSLGINERPSNSPKSFKTSKSCTTMSLPNLASGERITISPSFISNNYCDDEIESSDQPIDFSKKYCETKITNKTPPEPSTFNKVVKSYNSTFTMYAETDLDQPTDYSLRYAEDDSDSDNKIPKTEFVQDTIKTYCTEDTPYETPFNFSTSTSMSDLRLDDKATIDTKPESKQANITPINAKEISNVDKVKSGFSSGLMSPEKPVNYCEEGTPGYFSRVASCGSLNSIPVKEPPKQELKEDTLKKNGKFPSETKAVKFEEVVNYAEETPLMFSRSSSLASLDSIEQHSIHDDRSSVVSDFSRLTSGLISPSELPDSPSQTIPPSPKPRKNSLVFPKEKTVEETVPKSSVFEDVVKKFKMESTPLQFSTATSLSSLIDEELDAKKAVNKNNDLSEESSEDEDILAACINIGMQNNRYSQPKANSPPSEEVPQSNQKSDITSDSIRTYCTEDTPAILSQAGSNSDLSLLSLHNVAENKTCEVSEAQQCDVKESSLEAEDNVEVATEERSRHSSFSSISASSHESEEALLKECILAGMPKGSSSTERAQEDSQKSIESSDEDEDKNILADCINSGMKNNRYSQVNYNTLSTAPSKVTDSTYYTEGLLSHSDLTVLSAQSIEKLSDSEDEDERLLMECVRYGMAKIAGASTAKNYLQESPKLVREKVDLNISVENNVSDDDEDNLSFSSLESYESEQALLQECILAGMPKRPPSPPSDSNELTAAEKALLQQCILEGMRKCRKSVVRKPPPQDTSDLTEAERALLRQCILAGMPKNKNLSVGGPSRELAASSSTELTESERVLLQQCILAGMPKGKARRQKQETRREGVGHTCCIHCPRNNRGRHNNNGGHRRRRQIRDSRDVNILYVTSQILAMKKEIIDRSHEEWV